MATPKKQVMDVAKPGKSTPSSTSRPLIVNHGNILKDPMVTAEEPAKIPDNVAVVNDKPAAEEEKTTVAVRTAKIIRPPQPAEEEQATPKKDEPEPEKPEEPAEPASPSQDTSDSAIIDAVAEQADAKKKSKAEQDALKAQQEHFDKLVAEKTYFLPIGQVRRRHNRNLLIGLLVILLLAGGAAAAVDAELLNTGIELPFDLL